MSVLTPYEQVQVRQISGWKAEAPFLIVELLERATHPIVGFAKQFIPEKAVGDAVEIAYKASEVFAHQEEIAKSAGVTEIRELRSASLQQCDRLAEEYARKAGEGALARGAMVSSAGGMGAVIGLELMITYALKCVHTIGFCYGFTPQDPREKEFALSILLAAAAGTLKEKQKALADLVSLEGSEVKRDAVSGMKEATAEALGEEATETLAEEALEQVSQTAAEEYLTERVLESSALRAIPFLGIIVGAISDAAVAQYVGHTAKRVFQERWLRANRKVTEIVPDPRLVRSRLRRVQGAVGAGVYWTTFTASFIASWPVLFLASFVPPKSAVARGLAAGSADARRDCRQLNLRLRKWAQGKPPEPAPVAVGSPALGNC